MSKPNKIIFSIDVMGGDLGPRPCVDATLKFLQAHSHVSAVLVGKQSEIETHLPSKYPIDRLKILDVDHWVGMGDSPATVLREKKRSSMWESLAMVKSGEADVCVSAGNTGALMAISRHLVGTIEGMKRPAICKAIPTLTGTSFLLDLGANIDCSAEQLLQFALMGSAMAKVHGEASPRIALLNVGVESNKGGQEIQECAALLRQRKGVNFCGFIEGNAIYRGDVDVIVCDGFVGNVALKVSEGVVQFVLGSLQHHMGSSFMSKLLAFPLKFYLRGWKDRFNPARYNGAALLGLNAVVVKSHGASDDFGFFCALNVAKDQLDANIPQKLSQCF